MTSLLKSWSAGFFGAVRTMVTTFLASSSVPRSSLLAWKVMVFDSSVMVLMMKSPLHEPPLSTIKSLIRS